MWFIKPQIKRGGESLLNSIADIRKKNGLTQVQLAERVGMDRSYLNKIERGKVIPSISLLKKVALELKVQVKDFF